MIWLCEIQNTGIQSYDLCQKVGDTYEYRGSMILSGFRIREDRQPGTFLYIESFVSKMSELGIGSAMLQACEEIIKDHCPVNGHYYIGAQCVKVRFWKHRLFETDQACGLIFQLLHLFPSTCKLYTGITVRAKQYTRREAPGSPSSP